MDDNLRKGAAVAMEWSIKKAILLTASLCAIFCVSIFGGFEQTVEARAQVRVADREMKKSRDYQSSPLYERAHRIIYGMNSPQGPDGRVRIAIVINGDENIIVHDRVKNEIYQQLRKKFPREEFAVMKGSDVKTKLLQYAEDQFYGERGTATLVNRRTQSKTNSSGISGAFGIVKSITDVAVGAAAGGTSASGSGSGDSRDYSGSGSVNNSSTDYNRNTTVEYKDDRLDVDGLPVGGNREAWRIFGERIMSVQDGSVIMIIFLSQHFPMGNMRRNATGGYYIIAPRERKMFGFDCVLLTWTAENISIGMTLLLKVRRAVRQESLA